MSYKSPQTYLGEFEALVLLTILRLADDAYGVTIRDELARETRREVTLGAVYKTLGRLDQKGYVATRLGEPTPERGGRRKKLYRLTAQGGRALRQTLGDLRRLTRGLGGELEAL
jgi:DNA-binding PadR family transcriptional regulator